VIPKFVHAKMDTAPNGYIGKVATYSAMYREANAALRECVKALIVRPGS